MKKPSNRREGLLIGLVVALGVALRLAHWSATTVEHFDEGVYASNLWFGAEDGFRYPQQHLYAPPLVPWLIEWTMVLSGKTSGQVAVWPSVLVGIVTIVAVWSLARNVFGPRAGLIAGILAASSGTHVLLSRAALTDATLLFWFVLAIALFERACRTDHWRDFLGAGLAVGMAWWTKYNGWLPVFVVLASISLRWLVCPTEPAKLRRWCGGWCLAAVVAVILWSPYWMSLQSHGGYATVAANHRQYIVGLGGWWGSFTHQIANLAYIGGWYNLDLLGLAGGAVGTVMLFAQGLQTRRESARPGTWLLATWYCALGAMTPLYTPYPRLLLPWLAAGWIVAAAAVDALLRWAFRGIPNTPTAQAGQLPTIKWHWVIGLGIGLGISGLASIGSGRAWTDRTGLAGVASSIARTVGNPRESVGREIPVVVYIYGEPALVFQLRSVGIPLVSPVQTVDLEAARANGKPIPTYLVAGPHAARDRSFQSDWPGAAARFKPIAVFPFTPSTLVLLDNYAPRQLAHGVPQEEVRLYQVR